MTICCEPIGVLHCEMKDPATAPRFYSISNVPGMIEIYPPYVEGMDTLEEFEHIVVLFHFHLSKEGYTLKQTSPSGRYRGVFSLCSPVRPNGIGMSVLKVTKIEGPMIYVENVDMVDGTPILDIKPYKPLDEDTI